MTDDPLFPPHPDDPDSLVGVEEQPFRYEDIVQDGRVRLDGIWHPMGRLLWGRSKLGATLFALSRDHGIRFVLRRVVLEATDQRVAPRLPLRTELRYRFEHLTDDAGRVRRLLFNTWLRTTSEGDLVARAFGERVFSRLDAPPGERSVTRLPLPDVEPVPPHRGEHVPAEQLLDVPEGAEPLDAVPRLAPHPVVFGLGHTDMNQHVNFLAYPRLAEQAVLQRFVDLGAGGAWLGRTAAIAYRQPSFAGEILRVAVQAYRLGEQLGAVVAFVDDTPSLDGAASWSDLGQARTILRVRLSR